MARCGRMDASCSRRSGRGVWPKCVFFARILTAALIEELLDKGKIPYRRVGNRRRIRYDDLVRYREAEEQEVARREAAMRELVAETERLGIYR